MYACLATIQCVQHLDLTKACSMEHCERGKSNQWGDWGWPAEITLENDPQIAQDVLTRMLILEDSCCISSHPATTASFIPFFPLLLFSPLFYLLIFFFSEITFTTRVGGCYMLWPLQINFCARNLSQHFYTTLIYLTELNETE